MAKMFYTQTEAAAKLGKTPEELEQLVRDGRLRRFMDNGPVFRIEDIDKLAVASGAAPASHADAVDLELADNPGGASKEDTVITSAGISVFDDEDLQIEVDPMAQTSITQSVDDQVSLESTGSGSGLLDLTREADDTSLGAELLEEIYPTTPVEGAEVLGGPAQESTAASMADQGPTFAAPTMIEAADPTAGAFTGLALAGLLAVMIVGFALAAIASNTWPTFLNDLAGNPPLFGGGLAAVAVVFAVIGLVVGRSGSRT